VSSPEVTDSVEGDARSAKTGSTLANVRVLLVDDETDARDLALTALTQSGARVKAVSSGSEAFGALVDAPRELLPHVIISDLGMPAEDGFELMRRIRALEPERGRIPAVAITGYATADDIDRAMAAGFQLHIAKPMDPASVVAAVEQLVRNLTGPNGKPSQ
jgi:CheY-like chemotaxis protein